MKITDLPGKLAKRVIGMFPITLFAEHNQEREKGKEYIWRLKPTAKVKGVGLHVPQAISEKFPGELPQDWNEVERRISEV